MSKRLLVLASLNLSLGLAACAPAGQVGTPLPSGSPSASPVTPAPGATAAPGPAPTSAPSASPSASPTPQPTPEPTPQPTPTPTPEPTPEPTPASYATADLRIKVFNEDNSELSIAQVDISSNDSSRPFTARASLQNGFYIAEVPTGLTLKIDVTAPGHTTRSRLTAVSPTLNQLNLEFKNTFAISNRPEVIGSTPGYSGVIGADGVIELRFSENMDRESVERSFALQSDSPNETRFLVGTPIPRALTVRPNPSEVIYDIRHFTVEWDTDRVARFRARHRLPIASESRFRVSLSYNDGTGSNKTGGIKDVDGNSARTANLSTLFDEDGVGTNQEDGPFLVGNSYRAFLPFTVSDNLSPLRVTGIGSEVLPRDNFFLEFSGDLFFNIVSGATVIGGANGQSGNAPGNSSTVTAQQAARNYQLECNGTPVPLPDTAVAVFTLPNRVRISVPEDVNLFDTGDTCRVSFSNILDPAAKLIPNPSLTFTAN